ncbi:hypothetical protein BDZ91DRAFT_254905 [Kalaharituber pfeilii]|nr:hypothetical protein BDZ91DRAFT_254905 [Kalaharituber pfeilii]
MGEISYGLNSVKLRLLPFGLSLSLSSFFVFLLLHMHTHIAVFESVKSSLAHIIPCVPYTLFHSEKKKEKKKKKPLNIFLHSFALLISIYPTKLIYTIAIFSLQILFLCCSTIILGGLHICQAYIYSTVLLHRYHRARIN